MPDEKKPDSPYFSRYSVIVSVVVGVFSMLGGAWGGIQLYLRMQEPSSSLVATVEAYPFLVPKSYFKDTRAPDSKNPDFDFFKMTKFYRISITNTGMLAADDVRLRVPAENVISGIDKGGPGEIPLNLTQGNQSISLGNIDVKSQVKITIWADTPLTEQEEIVVAHSKGGFTKRVKETSSYGGWSILIVIVIAALTSALFDKAKDFLFGNRLTTR